MYKARFLFLAMPEDKPARKITRRADTALLQLPTFSKNVTHGIVQYIGNGLLEDLTCCTVRKKIVWY